MGGKSTVCRSVAAIAILAKAGYLVPAKTCSVSQNLNVFLNVGNGDAMTSNMSGFGAEASDMASLFQMTGNGNNVLAICDEMAAGTSHLEGSAVAIAYISALSKRNTIGLVSTHFESVLSAKEMETIPKKQMESLQGQFTYKLIGGICKYHYATTTCRQVGIPEEICVHADQIISKSIDVVCDISEQSAVEIITKIIGNYNFCLEKKVQCPVITTSCLYLLECEGGFYYVGESDNVAKRFKTHFASEKRPTKMYIFKMKNKSYARKMESEITSILKCRGIPLLSSNDGQHIHFGNN